MVIPPIPVANYVQLLVASAVAAKFQAYQPVAVNSGGETWYDGTGVFLCPDAATWRQVWDAHIKNEAIGNSNLGNLNPPPAVDFKKNIVVALFAGPTRGIAGYQVSGGFQLGQQAVLRLTPVVVTASAATVAIPRPWVFLVLKRSNVAVNIQTPSGDGWVTVTKVKPDLP